MTKTMLDLPEDSNLVVAELGKDRGALGNAFRRAHGLVIPYDPLTPLQREAVLDYAKWRISGRDLWHYESWHRLTEQPKDLPEGVRIITKDVKRLFKAATGLSPDNIALVINNDDPKDYHAHVATLTYALNGPGTEAHTTSGKPYTIPTGHIFMMAEGLPHRSPSFVPSRDDPRVMFAAF